MGRAKLRLELIANERQRMAAFKKRKEGLVKKIEELTTLCGVRACMIIYGPHQESREIEPETWPANKDEIREIIGNYEVRNGRKTVGLSDFFHDKRRKIEEELSSFRKKKWEAKVSAWTQSSPEELRILGENITLKYEIVKSRIEFMKRSCKEGLSMSSTMNSTWFHDPAMVPPPYTILPQPPWQWHETLFGVHGQGNLTEDHGIVAQPPYYTIPPQVPAMIPPSYTVPPQPPLPWHDEILDGGVCGRGNLTEDHGIVAQPPNYTIPPQVPAMIPPSYTVPPRPPLPWHDEILDGGFCGRGNLSEDRAIAAQPPNYTIPPQVPSQQLPFFWQEDHVDDVLFGVTGTTNWSGRDRLMRYE